MIILENADDLRADATNASEVDYTVHGLDNNALKQLSDGQLANSEGSIYLANSTDVIVCVILVNRGAAHNHVNLYLKPTGGTSRMVLPQNLQLEPGYALYFTGNDAMVLDTNGNICQRLSLAHSSLTGLTTGDDHTQYQREAEDYGLADGKVFKINSTLGTDHYFSGLACTHTAGEQMEIGEVGYMKSDGKIWKAKADATTTVPCLYMATAQILANASGVFLVEGEARDDTWNWTVGQMAGNIFLSAATAGALTHTCPVASTNQMQKIGEALSADTMKFAPSRNVFEHV